MTDKPTEEYRKRLELRLELRTDLAERVVIFKDGSQPIDPTQYDFLGLSHDGTSIVFPTPNLAPQGEDHLLLFRELVDRHMDSGRSKQNL